MSYFTFYRIKQNPGDQDCHWFNKEKPPLLMVEAAPIRRKEIWVPILSGPLTLLGPSYLSAIVPLGAVTVSPIAKSMGWTAAVILNLGCMLESPGEL